MSVEHLPGTSASAMLAGRTGKREMTDDAFAANLKKLETNLATVIRGKEASIRLVLVGLLADGHILLEDVPGTGKTTLAKSLARSIDGQFRRIQFTPDLLPADVTGSNYYNPKEGRFEFREGPVFSNVLLADEINRTSPRTQAALLEVMSERQVTIDGERRAMARPFFVIATQNPAEFHGTYPLPEAQLDRFMLRVGLGHPGREDEVEILFSQQERHPFEALGAVVSCEEVAALQEQVRAVHVDRSVAEYMVRVVEALRDDARLRLGVSTRGSLALFRCAQARARMSGRAHVLPEDVKLLAAPVLAHRVQLETKARYGGLTPAQLVEEALGKVPVPR
ncbi:MAG: MoxR family ATPase [Planctomycetota bacterium]|nr:MoxR family ATPase [Planctomycetota bacterium]